MKAKRWMADGSVDKTDVPDYSFENLEICREALLEAVAETSEEYMDRYFSGDEFSENEIRQALHTNVCQGDMVPISMASGTMEKGIYTLLDDIVKYLPSPEKRECKGIKLKTNQVFDADYNFAKAKSAYIFKTIVDPFIGKYSLIKVNSGVLKTDDVLYNFHILFQKLRKPRPYNLLFFLLHLFHMLLVSLLYFQLYIFFHYQIHLI